MNKDLRDALLKLKQEHLIRHYESLSEEEQVQFSNNLKQADFNKLAFAFDEKMTNEEQVDIKAQEFSVKSSLDESKLYDKGLELIKNNKAAMLIMAGGMGSRLGFDGAKGGFILANNKSVFEIHIDRLKVLYDECKVYPLLLIMCSDLNFNYTLDFFKNNNYFDYPKNKIRFFKQGNLPACDENYKVLLADKCKIKEVPDGNGGIFDALNKSGLLKELREEGIKWLHIAGVDNVLLRLLDPVFLAFAEDSKLNIASKSVQRIDESEKVGVFALKNSKPSVLEYSEISEDLLTKKNEDDSYYLSEANIASHLLNIESDEFKECLNLPFHKAYKKIDYYDGGRIINPIKENAYKYEQFIFDAFKNFDKMAVLRVNREEEFAALKNKEGKDSIESARKAYLDSLSK